MTFSEVIKGYEIRAIHYFDTIMFKLMKHYDAFSLYRILKNDKAIYIATSFPEYEQIVECKANENLYLVGTGELFKQLCDKLSNQKAIKKRVFKGYVILVFPVSYLKLHYAKADHAINMFVESRYSEMYDTNDIETENPFVKCVLLKNNGLRGLIEKKIVEEYNLDIDFSLEGKELEIPYKPICIS